MRTNRMLATAAVAAVTMVAVTGGAGVAASAASPSAGKGSVSSTASSKPGEPGRSGDQDAVLRKIAASLHVSLATLENALRDMKKTSGKLDAKPTDPRVVAVFAKDLGISNNEALKVLNEIVGQPGPGGPKQGGDQDAVLRKIAASLHVSLATLENALRDMKKTSGKLGADPTDPRVVAVFAKDLKISNNEALKILTEIVGLPGPVKPAPPGKTPTSKTPPGKSPAPAPSGKA